MISVIVPARNAMPWLDDQISALTCQSHCDEFEIVVADNASTDQTATLVRDWEHRTRSVRYLDASEAHGPGATRNAGVRASSGAYLAFCDADDIVLPGWLSSHARALAGADVVAGTLDIWSLNGMVAPVPPVYPRPPAMQQFGYLPAGMTCNLSCSRIAFDEIGGFDEHMVMGEDYDLCWKAQLQGYAFAVTDDAVVARRDRSGFVAMLRRSVTHGRGGPLLYRKYRGSGMKRDGGRAVKAWIWVVGTTPLLARQQHRRLWAINAGCRAGRLSESVRQRVLYL